MKMTSPATKASVDIELPDHSTLETSLPGGALAGAVRCPTYTLCDGEHALRHASCLLKILHGVAVPDGTPKHSVPPFSKHITWLVDCIEALNGEQKRWRDNGNHDPVSLLNQALKLVVPRSGVDQVVIHKLYSVIVLLAADVAESPTGPLNHEQFDSSANKALALALVQIADAAIKQRPVSKLAAAQLLKPLEHMLADGIAGDVSGDLQVRPPWSCSLQPKPDFLCIKRSVTLFREAVASPVTQPFSPGLSPQSFVDRDIRRKVQSIESKAHTPTEQRRLVKRRKITQESSVMPHVLQQLCRVLRLPQATTLGQLESHIL